MPARSRSRAPARREVVDLGSLGHATGTDAVARSRRRRASTPSAPPCRSRSSAPDSLVGLPRTGVRLISDGKDAGRARDLRQGPRRDRRDRARGDEGAAAGQPARRACRAVSIGGATGHELPTALGTLITVERGGVSYTLVGSLPPNAAEAALRAVLGMTAGRRGPRTRQDLRRDHGRRPRRPDRRARRRLRLPRPERRRQDDVAPHAARADPPEQREREAVRPGSR